MEALAAVGLASNVAQFLGYGIEGVRMFMEIVRDADGISKQNSELRDVTTHITETMRDIRAVHATKTADGSQDGTLHALVAKALDLCQQILEILNSIKMDHVKGKLRVVEGAYKAGQAVWKKGELEQLSTRLFNLRAEVSSHLIFLIEQQQRDIQRNLRQFTTTSDLYQESFGKFMNQSMNYLETISRRLDKLAIGNRDFGSGGKAVPKNTYERLLLSEEDDKAELDIYIHNVGTFYGKFINERIQEKQKSILETLSFSQLHERELAIPQAHQDTFEWIFQGDFSKWLRTENSIFWINGKAGSGKSTLMKFIAEHRMTELYLKAWAGLSLDPEFPRDNLVTARYYFWSPGTRIQKSQEGLLRSLLLQILSKHPHLVESVCADRWAADWAESITPWTWQELVKAMMSLSQQRSPSKGTQLGTPLKICLFIDGLDEYEGEHTDLIHVLYQVSQSPNVKICTSSRPWIEFSDAFGSSTWKTCIHDLTLHDIRRYVQDKLGGDEAFKRLHTRSTNAASDLINSIVQRSEGVFLWVFFVVRSLLRGLRNEDTMSTLLERLDALPSDLENFFERMLDSLEDVYRKRAARLFLTLSHARQSFPVFTFLFFNFEDRPTAVQAEELAFLGEWPAMDSAPLDALMTKKRQLIAQCKDMIHIAPDSGAPILFGEKVSFLHRTIFDFIHTDQASAYLQGLAGDFDPRLLLFDAYLGQSRALMGQYRLSYLRPHLRQWILACLFYAYEVEVASDQHCEQVHRGLDELEGIVSQAFHRWDLAEGLFTILGDRYLTLLHLAAKCDLATYVQHKLAPQCTATELDRLAPGWREPREIIRDADFEIQKRRQQAWRLGNKVQLQEQEGPYIPLPASTLLPVPGSRESPSDMQNVLRTSREKRRSRFLRKLTSAFH